MPKHTASRLLALLLASAFALAAQNVPPQTNISSGAPAILSPSPAYKFPNGQVFNYAVEWRLFDAGIATIRMDAAGREQRVVATADARGVVGLLYHVHDRFESFFDPATNCSRSIEKKTEEGFRRLETNISFDATRKKSLLREKNLRSNESKSVENDTPGCVKDVASAVFYIASQPLMPGATLFFSLNDGGKTVDVKATAEAREEVKVPAGTFKTIRVLAAAASESARNKGQVWIWYTDDARHLPVQMRARLFWGTLTFRLK
ncbi:MAG TPA: DUF3108 domain-containing protein [Terriglobales bacterium]|nr:DUF3108 domain-containing protein [Terriglobales bacterium]